MRKPAARVSFEALKSSPESMWIVDVAILSLAGKELHCALVQDLKTLCILGWASAQDACPTLVMQAVERACTRHVRTRPTNLYLDSGFENSTPQVIAALVCEGFQLRFFGVQEQLLLRPLENVWRGLQARFTAAGAIKNNDDWFD